MTDNTKMREAFEKFAMKEGMILDMYKLSYLSDETYSAWKAWQAAQSVPVVGEPVAWVRRHPDGALTAEFLEDAVIEPVRRNSGGWLPLFVQPANSIPAAELERLRSIVAEVAGGILHDIPLRVCSCAQCELIRKAKDAIAGEKQ